VDDTADRKPVYDPQQLEPLLVSRQHAGDVDGMTALFEPDAVIDCGGGNLLRGKDAIRSYYAEIVASGRKCDLALTSTRLPDGDVTSEVARRQGDGSWLWVIDRYSVT